MSNLSPASVRPIGAGYDPTVRHRASTCKAAAMANDPRSDVLRHADTAMVSTIDPLATRAGVDAMAAGGNAVDAAIATGFAMAVVHPSAGNIGGGGFMVIRLPDGRATATDFL